MGMHTHNWWAVVVRGVVAVLFGIAAILQPGIALIALIALFGAYALIDGVFSIVGAVRAGQHNQQWWVLALEGIAGIVVGLLTFFWPGVTALVLLYYIGAWAIITGVLEIAQAIRLRREIDNEWMLALAGVVSLVFGVLVVVNPGSGALAIVWVIGVYALIFGVILIALGLRLRGLQEAAPAL
jgi:uncharacterized membrane protein HdeD (DUF308 family)